MPTRKEIDEMAKILAKLENATSTATQEMVTESAVNPESGLAVSTQRTQNGVTISKFDIQTDKKTVAEGLTKTFYQIVDNQTGEIIARDLGLFESAMGIVKHLLYTKKTNKAKDLIDLDGAYVGALIESYQHKKRMSRLDESTVAYDVTAAKYSQSKQRVGAAKVKILKAL